jgi:hypothetical protein
MEEQLTLALAKVLEWTAELEGYAPIVLEQMVRNGLYMAAASIAIGWVLFLVTAVAIIIAVLDATGKIGGSVDWVFGMSLIATLAGMVAITCLIFGYIGLYRWANMPELMILKEVIG